MENFVMRYYANEGNIIDIYVDNKVLTLAVYINTERLDPEAISSILNAEIAYDYTSFRIFKVKQGSYNAR